MSIASIYSREINPYFKSEAERAVNDLLDTIYCQSSDAADRIYNKIDFSHVPPYLTAYIPDLHSSNEQLYATDRPEVVFGAHDTIYAVTSLLALENIQDGNVLLPTSEHYAHRVHTHRGIGLAILSGLMDGFQVSMGLKDRFIWLGSQIDGEQYVLDDAIAQKGSVVDDETFSMLFAAPEKGYFPRLHPCLKAIVEAMLKGESLYATSPEHKMYIDNLLDTLYRNTGVRDGWFVDLEELLKGHVQPQKPISVKDFERELYLTAKDALLSPKPSRAAVLAVDTAELMRQIRLFVFPLTSRHPDVLIPASRLPLTAIKAIPLSKYLKALSAFRNCSSRSKIYHRPVGYKMLTAVPLHRQ